jgi:uncharacterized protein YxeA
LDNKSKTLIIVLIILLAVFGVVAGIILQGYLFDSKNGNLNQTNTSVNVTVDNQTTENKNQNNLISAQKAISIVKQNAGPSKNVRFSAKLIQNGNNPYYQISVYSTNRNSTMYGENIGGARVDARTGEFLGGMG